MSKLISIILIIAVIIFGLVLGILNPSFVMLDGFFFKREIPLSLIIAVSLVIGLIIGTLLIATKLWYVRWQLKGLKKINQNQADKLLVLQKEKIVEENKSKFPHQNNTNVIKNTDNDSNDTKVAISSNV